MKNNSFLKIGLVCLAGFLFSTAYADEWATDPVDLDNVHQTTSAACSPSTDRLCADSGDCLAPASFPAVPADQIAVTAGVAAAQVAAPNGGWVYNAYGLGTCASGDNWLCITDPTDVSNHVQSLCTGAGLSSPAATVINTTTGCTSGYTNCDATAIDCEVQIGSTAYPGAANAVYTSTCTAVCDGSHLSCTGSTADAANDGDGCEITENVTPAAQTNTLYSTSCSTRICTSGTYVQSGDSITVDGCEGTVGESCTVTATGLPGSCTGAGSTGTAAVGTCACSESAIPEFAGGGSVDGDGNYTVGPVKFSSATALLQGDNTHVTGAYVQFGDDAGGNDDGVLDAGEVEFEIDGSGVITAGFIGIADLSTNIANDGLVMGVNASGQPAWLDPATLSGSADDLGDHTATQNLNLAGFKLIGAVGDTNGVSIAADNSGDFTIDGSLTASGIAYPSADGTVGQMITTNGLGVLSWQDVPAGYSDGDVATYLSTTYPNLDTDSTDDLTAANAAASLSAWDQDGADDVTVGAAGSCADTEVLQYDTDHWACVAASSLAGAAQTLDDAYDTGTDAATRTVAVDGDAIRFAGQSGLTANVFEVINEGSGNAMVVNDGTNDLLVVDDAGNTVVRQLRLVASVADGTGKPTAACAAASVGDIAYATLGGTGRYYGCKEVTTGVYSWVALEVFGG